MLIINYFFLLKFAFFATCEVSGKRDSPLIFHPSINSKLDNR